MSNSNQTLELERCRGTKQEWVAYIDAAKYPNLATADDKIAQFKKDLADWLTANNEWGNVHVVSELPYCVLLSCDAPIAAQLANTLPGITQLQEWIEK
ncbi:MAG: hypothetical protein P4L53_04455 [Candidatus Obscuribacterales bacterium]|nr:hypothetical protein [Candidatus Obscuribacterales bacterium]